MSIFVKQFDIAPGGAFSTVRNRTGNAAMTIAVGNVGAAAAFVSVDPSGNVVAQWQYALAGAEVRLISVLETADGYLAFGAVKSAAGGGGNTKIKFAERSLALVVRLNGTGNVVWAKTYGNANTRTPIGLVALPVTGKASPIFVFANRNNATEDKDDLELMTIDLAGKVLASKMLSLQIDQNSAANLSIFGNGAAIFGGTNEMNQYKGFIIGFDVSLKINYRKWLSGAINQQILALNRIGNQFVATGVAQMVAPPTGGGRPMAKIEAYSFLFKFDNQTTSAPAKVFDLQPGFDSGAHTVFSDEAAVPNHYLLSCQPGTGSVAAKFDNQFNLLWSKQLNLPDKHFAVGGAFVQNEILACGWVEKAGAKSLLLYRTDKEYATCATIENPKPAPLSINFVFSEATVAEATFAPAVADLQLKSSAQALPNRFVCPANEFNLGGLIQSPYLYMQAAGSDQADASSKGVHLRWRFQKSLGDKHLAKGSYADPGSPYATSIGFNKPNDFVKIFRAPYGEPYPVRIQIKDNILPTTEIKSGNQRVWNYNNIPLSFGTGTVNVAIRFNDVAQYDTLRSSMTALKPETLMKQYKGIVEVEPVGKLFFKATLRVAYNPGVQTSAYLRAETISYDDSTDPASVFVACRKKFTVNNKSNDLNNATILGENLKYARLDFSIAYLSEIQLETYADFVTNTKNVAAGAAWEFLGDFALTLDTALAFDRLENQNNLFVPANKKFSVDKQWNKYNDADAATGAFKIRADNYKHRWLPAPNAEHPGTKPENGVQKAVEKYLTLSKTNLKAAEWLAVENDPGNEAKLEVSYFDILRLVSLDYHVARMLGLGHIDADVADGRRFVYLMTYTSKGALEPNQPAAQLQDHLYMSLPTGLKNYRLPPPPVQLPVTYGMNIDLGFGNFNPLTDANGYVPFDMVRFVNINRQPFAYEKPFGAFFADPTEFCLADETIPIRYGVEYREQSELAFRKPELTQDDEYFDTAGFGEVVEIAEQGKNPLYIHQEREEGAHCYALYAINWFSRVSPLSNTACTDQTKFQKIKSLLPPSNFGVQLIQPESPLMLTTEKEQTMLGQLSTAPDKTLLRATFEWNHNHNENYQFAERAQFFYRESPPDSIRGEVASVFQLPGNKVLVRVKTFQMLSTSPAQTVSPAIPAGQEQKYVGSLFACGQQAYIIDAINNGNPPYPVFTLKQIRQTDSSDPLLNNQIVSVANWLKPAPGERFLVAENMSNPANWGTQLQRTVYIEKFHTNHVIRIENGGAANNGVYRLEKVEKNGNTQTNLMLLDKFNSNIVAGSNIRYERVYRLKTLNATTQKMTFSGNVGSDFPSGGKFRLFGSSYLNDKDYVVSGTPAYSPTSGITVVGFTGALPEPSANFGYVAVEKTAPILALDRKKKTVTVQGNLAALIIPPYIETRIEQDKKETKHPYGGIFRAAEVEQYPNEYEDKDENGNPIKDTNGNPVIIKEHIGAYTVKFNDNFNLPPHIDPGVEWHKGVARILNTDTNKPAWKSLQVWGIIKKENNNPVSNLQLVVFDPDFDKKKQVELIKTGQNVMVNFHPSYRVYLKPEFNAANGNDATHQFNEKTILPAIGDGSKMTYMGIRSMDRFKEPRPPYNIVQYDSFIAPQVPVLAREVAELKSVLISGPKFATRPDFYKKSTYTIDIELDTSAGRKPYGIVAFRGSETQVLSTLYKGGTWVGTVYTEGTLEGLLRDIESLKKNTADATAYYSMLHDLVNVVLTNGQFAITPNSKNFKFPLPDNDQYIIPDRDPKKKDAPFANPIDLTVSNNRETVRQAILDSFLPLTEQPVIYKYVKGGLTASGKKPLFRNQNGDLIVPVLPDTPGYDPDKYDPHPMAVKFAKKADGTVVLPKDADYATAKTFFIRFTDFTLDGASRELYFYYVCEINNQLVVGGASKVIAPVLMVNTAPAEQPGIREVFSILEDPTTGAVPSVRFKLNQYNESEGITQFWIYRAYNSADATSTRTMKLAKKVDADKDVVDDFSDLPMPPFGETLFYRIMAVRRIQNELSKDEDVLSLPSKPFLTNVVDVRNPPPPKLYAENGTSTPAALQNVVLRWKPTAYNGTYYLQKLGPGGIWETIHEVKSKDAEMQYPPIDATNGMNDFAHYNRTQNLPRTDANGNALFHRFRVQVQNASGLFNLTDTVLTLARGEQDLEEAESVLAFRDGTGHELAVLESTEFTTGANHPMQLIFSHRNRPLPPGHNTFVKVEITVFDDLNHSFNRTLSAPGTEVTFGIGQGGLNLDTAYPNRIYTVQTKLFTDFAPAGVVQIFTLNYLSGLSLSVQQGRRSIPVFDAAYYLGQYADLRTAFGAENYAAATAHWLTFGIKEGRRSSAMFDVKYYLGHYPDLQTGFGAQNYAAAVDHWIKYGRKEGRKGVA